MRYLATAVTFLVTFAGVAAAAVVTVLVFAGPHSDILPKPLQVLVYVLAWVVVLAVPFIAARAVWRRSSHSAASLRAPGARVSESAGPR